MGETAEATSRTDAPIEGLPPGPRMPRALQDVATVTRLRPFLRRAQRRYGDIFTVRVHRFGNIVAVGDPELIKRTFTASPRTLYSGEGSALGPVLGINSLLVIDEQIHLRQRKLLLPPFHGERMRAYESTIERIATDELAQWREGEEFPVAPSTMRITLRAILVAVFGAHDEVLQRLEELVPRMTELGSALTPVPILHHDLGPLSPWGRFRRMRAEFDALCDDLIDEAKHDPELERRPDVLALMVQARHDDGSRMRNEEIRDQLMTMLAAGHETTAATLAWTVERLRRHPGVLARLVAEADAGGRDYRDATIREVQRLRPVIMFSIRIVKRPFELGGYVLPPGTRIALGGALTHYDERLFPDALRFSPERFLGRAPETYAWIPFGGGIRRCIGATFAHMEMDVVLRTLLRMWTLEPTTAPPERLKFRGVAYAPADGGLARVRRREPRALPARAVRERVTITVAPA
ncbi:cytochrome P450 [Conexibacter stalactiti]|uniref:Cytochrome P450 n=1 Tax=Conexibacter stalactiti TaxID=1940611 RepID=A0ABU4I0A7_9ACTN|nr:cytochrome P450 [Conexibacter stalactiti]MDW5598387.1 cytochrome P450 [Conexibacter stalactiti]MEC5039029.1 cytochrome P450 [Conexibacter stalactiti]